MTLNMVSLLFSYPVSIVFMSASSLMLRSRSINGVAKKGWGEGECQAKHILPFGGAGGTTLRVFPYLGVCNICCVGKERGNKLRLG